MHDAVLDHFATSACGVYLAGCSRMGVGTYFGNHATVLLSVRVGPFTTVRDDRPGIRFWAAEPLAPERLDKHFVRAVQRKSCCI